MVSKIRAGVFFGGPSVEHEVSVITAMQAIRALDPDRYQVIPVYVSKQGDFYTGEHLASLESYRNIPAALEMTRRAMMLLSEPTLFDSRAVLEERNAVQYRYDRLKSRLKEQ